MNNKLNILVVFGGKSAEHEISVMSARSVAAALSPEHYNVFLAGISRSGRWIVGCQAKAALEKGVVEDSEEGEAVIRPGYQGHSVFEYKKDSHNLLDLNFDVIFPVLHGTFGEDGTIQGLLEMADIPYVGDGVMASALGMDKALIKDVWAHNGLPVLPSTTLLRSSIESNLDKCIEKALKKPGLPCFVKPANAGSSVGITKAETKEELRQSLLTAAKFDRKVLVEAACQSPREIEVGVIGNDIPECSVPGEITYTSKFYDYSTKYHNDGAPKLLIPAPLPSEKIIEVQKLARKAWTAADLNGLARIDFLMDDKGNIWLNEVNTLPGFTQFSMFSKLWEASGVPYGELLSRLINLAIARYNDRKRILFKP
ncbi:MAG: D-alanine--D-alanine ligase family protein [Candidatus Bruticola sp.]